MSKYSESQLKQLKRYFNSGIHQETRAWLGIVSYYRYSIPPVIAAIIAIAIYMRPFPPEHTYLAAGQVGSSYAALAQEFVKIFTKNGLQLQVATGSGLAEGLHKLSDDQSPINASFVYAGTGKASDYPHLVSLGSVQLSPIWLFYRGKEIETDDPFAHFAKRPIAIGQTDSVSHQLFHRLMAINNPGIAKQANYREISNAEAADQLIHGQLDALLIVDSFESETIQKLLDQPDINIYNFHMADAYLKKLPMLEKVVIPRGSLDLKNMRPSKDITMLASNVNLLVEKNVHPAIQWAFLKAAREIHLNNETFFYNAGHYPRYIDKSFPLSPTAQRYYSAGIPEVFHYFPLWLAALIDYVWVAVLTLVLVLAPLAKYIFGLRSFGSKKMLWNFFRLLKHLEYEIQKSATLVQAQQVLDEINELEALVLDCWFEDQDIRFYYSLRGNIEKVKNAAVDYLTTMQVAQNTTPIATEYLAQS